MKLATWVLRGSITLFFFTIYFLYLHYINHGYALNDDQGFYLLTSTNPQDAPQLNSFFYIYFHIVTQFTNSVVFFRLFSVFLFASSASLLAFTYARFFPVVRSQSSFYTLLTSMLICVSLNFIDFPIIPNYNIFNIAACTVVYSLILVCLEANLTRRLQLFMYSLVGFFIGFVFLDKFPTGIILLVISLVACFFDKKEYSRIYNTFYIFIGIATQFILFFMFLHPFASTVQEIKYSLSSPVNAQGHPIFLIITQSFTQTLASVFFSAQKYWAIYLTLLTVFVFRKKWSKLLIKKIVIFSLIAYSILALINLRGYFLTPWLFGRLNHEFYYSAALTIVLTYLIYFDSLKNYLDVVSNSREIFLIVFLFFLPFIQAIGTNCLFPDCVVNGFFMWIPLIYYFTLSLSPVLGRLFSTVCLFVISLVTMSIIVINLHQTFSSMDEKIDIRGAHLTIGKDTKYLIEQTRSSLKICGFKSGDYLSGNPSLAMIYAVSARNLNQTNHNRSSKTNLTPYKILFNSKRIPLKVSYIFGRDSFMGHIENLLRNHTVQHKFNQFMKNRITKNPPLSSANSLKNYVLCSNVIMNVKTRFMQYSGMKVYKLKTLLK